MALATFDKRNPAPFTQDANGCSLKPLGDLAQDHMRLVSPEIQYTALTALATGNTVDVLDLPAGIQIKDVYVISTEALVGGGTQTLKLDTVGNVAASTSALALNAATAHPTAPATTKASGAGVGAVLTATDVLRVTIAFTVAITAGKFRVVVDAAKIHAGQ